MMQQKGGTHRHAHTQSPGTAAKEKELVALALREISHGPYNKRVRASLKAFVEKNAGLQKPTNITRLMRSLTPGTQLSDWALAFFKGEIAKIYPEDVEFRLYLEKVRENAEKSYLHGERTAQSIGAGTASLSLLDLLGIRPEHLSLPKMFIGKYFGYRRSANTGSIVRMYVEIYEDKKSNLIKFRNYYSRNTSQWETNGIALKFGANTDFIGFAHDIADDRQPLGLRSFSLRYFQIGWFIGPLLTTANIGQPIAARIVLIPVDQHPEFHSKDGISRDEILKFISFDVQEDYFDHLRIADNMPNPYENIGLSKVVHDLISNVNFTTLKLVRSRINEQNSHIYDVLDSKLMLLTSFLKSGTKNELDIIRAIASNVSDDILI